MVSTIYNTFTFDVPYSKGIILATFLNYMGIVASKTDLTLDSKNLQITYTTSITGLNSRE